MRTCFLVKLSHISVVCCSNDFLFCFRMSDMSFDLKRRCYKCLEQIRILKHSPLKKGRKNDDSCSLSQFFSIIFVGVKFHFLYLSRYTSLIPRGSYFKFMKHSCITTHSIEFWALIKNIIFKNSYTPPAYLDSVVLAGLSSYSGF